MVDMHQAKRNMAHVALYSNLTIDDWTGLYSEPVTNFPDFHDFDAVSVNTPGAFAGDMLVDVDASPEVASSVSGEGSAAIIANTTVQAILAVNALLDAGTPVGLILEGEYAGDYVVSSDSLADVANRFRHRGDQDGCGPSGKDNQVRGESLRAWCASRIQLRRDRQGIRGQELQESAQ